MCTADTLSNIDRYLNMDRIITGLCRTLPPATYPAPLQGCEHVNMDKNIVSSNIMTMTTPPPPRQVVITASQGWGEGVCQVSLYFSPNMWILWILWSQHQHSIEQADTNLWLVNDLLCNELCAHHETTTDISVKRYLHICISILHILPMSALHFHVTRPNNHSRIWCYVEAQQAYVLWS